MPITQHYDLDIDTTLGGNNASDYIIPSQKAIKAYVDNNSGGGATALSGLTDVTLTSPASGDVLAYDGSSWVNNSKYLKNDATISGSIIISGGNSQNSANAVGLGASAMASANSVAIGSVAQAGGSTSSSAVAIGRNAKATGAENSIAIGAGAKADYSGSIQLGYGENATSYSLMVGFNDNAPVNYKLIDKTGLIPDARLSSNIARMPDYANKVLVASGRVATETSYTCPSDGYLLCVCITGYSGAPATIKLNDLLVVSCTSASTSYSSATSAIFPVFSGDEVKYLMNYQYLYANRAIYFVPMKGV